MKKKKILTTLIIPILGIALLGSGVATYVINDSQPKIEASSAWESFSPRDKKFSIEFPQSPEEEAKMTRVGNKKIKYNEMSTEHQDFAYSVTYMDFPGSWKLLGANFLLKKTFSKMVEAEKNIEKVLRQQLMKHRGLSALDYSMKQAGKEVHGRLIVSGNTLYILSVKSPASDKTNAKSFLNSFKVKK